jgi:hypothetical protein
MKMSFSFPIKSLIWFSFALLLFYLSECSSTTVGFPMGKSPVAVEGGPPAQALGDYVMIETENDQPYLKHKKHKQKYPPGRFNKREKWASNL